MHDSGEQLRRSAVIKLVTRVSTIFDQALNSLAVFVGVLVIFVMLTTAYDVAMRSLLNRPSVWVIEVSEISLVGITFLGAAWVLRGEGHVKVDILLLRLDPKKKALLNSITSIVGIIICLVVAWYGAKVTWEQFEGGIRSPTMLAPPTFPDYLVISLGTFLLAVQFLRRAYGYLKGDERVHLERKEA